MFHYYAGVYTDRVLPLPRGIGRHSWAMDARSSKETTPTSSASEESSARLLPTVTNENWRGKNNPQERRRIQNRINQRAFRQRQRAGESSKPYKPRNSSGSSSRGRRSDDTSQRPPREEETAASASSASSPTTITAAPSIPPETSSGSAAGTLLVAEWDELGQLINRNFMSAAVTNAQLIGLDGDALRNGSAITTPRPTNAALAAPLQPVQLQLDIAHDPIIDIIPHPQFRHNILRAIAAGQIDNAEFVRALRASGSLESAYGPGMRGGLVVWSFPEQLASWELSEPFIRRYAFLLQGCDDLLAATNVWRSRRGEQPFPLSSE